MYASPDPQLRRKLWKDLSFDKVGLCNTWMAVGDFNSVIKEDEVSNPATFCQARCKDFKDWVCTEGLVDLGFTGPSFTWTRGKDHNTFKGARLDRALCSPEWLEAFPDVIVKHLPKINSDHSPILIELDKRAGGNTKSFSFQQAWMTHPEFEKVIEENWNKESSTMENNLKLAPILEAWNREHFGNIFKRKDRLMRRLNGVQKALTTNHHGGILKLERRLRQELEATLHQEEIFWHQKSREEWICSGDSNTKYYHAVTTINKARKKVLQLKDNSGNWISDPGTIKDMIREHFSVIFTQDQPNRNRCIAKSSFPMLDQEIWELVNAEFSTDDIKEALFAMAPTKAPGPDGFNSGFYQRQWGIVGDSMLNRLVIL